MKTYYFSGYWEEPWECGDGCCSGGGNYHINFDRLEIDGEEVEWNSWFGTEWEEVGPYLSVHAQEYEEDAPDGVHEMSEQEAIRWLKEQLAKAGVSVVVEIDE